MADREFVFEGGPVSYQPRDTGTREHALAEKIFGTIPGVQGFGEGQNEVGDPAWVVYVTDRSVEARLPTEVSGRPVLAEVSGVIDILPA